MVLAAVSQILYPEGWRPFIYAIHPEQCEQHVVPVWSCFRWGLPGGFDSHQFPVVSYTTISPLPGNSRRYNFCGTFLPLNLNSMYPEFPSDILLCEVRTFLISQHKLERCGRPPPIPVVNLSPMTNLESLYVRNICWKSIPALLNLSLIN